VDQKWLMEKVTKLSKYKNYLMALQSEKDVSNGRIDPSRENNSIYNIQQERQEEGTPEESLEPINGGGNQSFTDSRSGSYVTYYKNQHELYQLQYDTAQEERMMQYDNENQQFEINNEEGGQISLAPLDYNKIKMFIFHSQEEIKV